MSTQDSINFSQLPGVIACKDKEGEITGLMLVSLEESDELLQQLNDALK